MEIGPHTSDGTLVHSLNKLYNQRSSLTFAERILKAPVLATCTLRTGFAFFERLFTKMVSSEILYKTLDIPSIKDPVMLRQAFCYYILPNAT